MEIMTLMIPQPPVDSVDSSGGAESGQADAGFDLFLSEAAGEEITAKSEQPEGQKPIECQAKGKEDSETNVDRPEHDIEPHDHEIRQNDQETAESDSEIDQDTGGAEQKDEVDENEDAESEPVSEVETEEPDSALISGLIETADKVVIPDVEIEETEEEEVEQQTEAKEEVETAKADISPVRKDNVIVDPADSGQKTDDSSDEVKSEDEIKTDEPLETGSQEKADNETPESSNDEKVDSEETEVKAVKVEVEPNSDQNPAPVDKSAGAYEKAEVNLDTNNTETASLANEETANTVSEEEKGAINPEDIPPVSDNKSADNDNGAVKSSRNRFRNRLERRSVSKTEQSKKKSSFLESIFGKKLLDETEMKSHKNMDRVENMVAEQVKNKVEISLSNPVSEISNGRYRESGEDHTELLFVPKGKPITPGAEGLENSGFDYKLLDAHQHQGLIRHIARQIVPAMISQVAEGKTRMVINLRPPQLGRVTIQLISEGENLSGRIQVESELVKQSLERGFQELKRALKEQGVEIEKFEVTVNHENEWHFDRPERGKSYVGGLDFLGQEEVSDGGEDSMEMQIIPEEGLVNVVV